jgi:hypothetical protein
LSQNILHRSSIANKHVLQTSTQLPTCASRNALRVASHKES